MERVQHNLVSKYPDLAGAVVDPESAHLTVMVMKLGDGSMEVPDCAELLHSSSPVLKDKGLLKPITINLRGLGTFGKKVRILILAVTQQQDKAAYSALFYVSISITKLYWFDFKKVLFLEVQPGEGSEQIALLASILSDIFSANGLENNGKEFKGHVTIAKMSKMPFGKKWQGKKQRNNDEHRKNMVADQTNLQEERLRFIPEDSYKEMTDIDAGEVTIDKIQLCQMGGRIPKSYYQIVSQISLDSS